MASRMDKYHSSREESIKQNTSRFSKNEQLYEQLSTNKVVTEFTTPDFDNIVDLSKVDDNSNTNKREYYQKNRYLNQTNTIPKMNSYLDLNHQETEDEDPREKNYNINDVLENARNNRNVEDEVEKKRRLKSVEYSILSDLSKEAVNKYHESKQKKLTKEEEENLEELIHTITSNSLRKKIDDELLSDLLPSEELDVIVSEELVPSENQNIEESDTDVEENKIDDSFYTKSMDLSKEDFELEADDRSFLEDRKMGVLSKILIILFVLIIIGIIIYIIYHFI